MHLGQRKKTILFVRSREFLYESEKPQELLARRTKIIASISDNSNSYEKVKELVLAGANCLKYVIVISQSLNITYQKSMDAV
jgi:pyruvate kinase